MIISLGFAANGYKSTRGEVNYRMVNYSVGWMDDCLPDRGSRDEIASD